MNRQAFAQETLAASPFFDEVGISEELVLGLCCWWWAENSGGSNTIPGAGARNNPADMTEQTPTASPFNTFGTSGQYHVYNYAAPAVGIRTFWRCVQNGRYDDIVAVLKNKSAKAEELAQCKSLVTWGTGTFEAIVEDALKNPAPYYAPEVAGSAPTAEPPAPLSISNAMLGNGGRLWTVEVATNPQGCGRALCRQISWVDFGSATAQGSDPDADGEYWHTVAHVQERTGDLLLTVTDAPPSSVAVVFVETW